MLVPLPCFAYDALTTQLINEIKAEAQEQHKEDAEKARAAKLQLEKTVATPAAKDEMPADLAGLSPASGMPPDPPAPAPAVRPAPAQPAAPAAAPPPPERAVPAFPLPPAAAATQPATQPSEPATATTATVSPPENGWKNIIREPAAIFTFVTALCVVGIFYITVDTTRRKLRAYIFVTDAILVAATSNGTIIFQEGSRQLSPIRQDDRVVSQITFTNTGETPATHVSIEGSVKILDWPLDESRLVLEGKKGRSFENMGAGSKRSRIDQLNKDTPGKEIATLSATDMENLKAGKVAVWVYGVIRYRDIFDRPQNTYYRYFMGGPMGVRGLNLAAHDKGNNAS